MKPKSAPSKSTEITSAAQRLRFAVRFAQLDLEALRPGDWLNLQWDLRDFLNPTRRDLGPGGLYVAPADPPAPEEYSREDFRALQAETRAILSMVIESRDDVHAWTFMPLQIRFASLHVAQSPENKQERQTLIAEGTTRDMVLLRLWMTLGTVNTAGLLRCPECGTVFFRQRNQDYCSRTCVNRVSQRRWRERQETAGAKAQ